MFNTRSVRFENFYCIIYKYNCFSILLLRRNNQLATAKKPKNFDDREMATIMAFLRNQSPPNSPLLVPSP